MKKSVRWIAPLVWTLLIAGGIALVLVESETALDVTLDALKLVFTIVSTPFVLETTTALVFCWPCWLTIGGGCTKKAMAGCIS